MATQQWTEYSATPASNSTSPPVGAPEGMAPSAVNDTMREHMSVTANLGLQANGMQNYYTTTFSTPVYTIAAVLNAPATITAGYTVGVQFNAANPASATLAITGVNTGTAYPLVYPNGTALAAGELNTTEIVKLTFNGTQWQLNRQTNSPTILTVPTPTLWGLTLSNDVTNPNTVLDIAAGAAIDRTATYYMSLASVFTKTFSNFAAGAGNGALDTGTKANSTWYHVYLISTSAGLTDILFSLSATAPTMPATYIYRALLGAIYVNGSGNILPFSQNGNEFLYTTSFVDVNNVAVPTTATLLSLTLPSGVKLGALFRVTFFNQTSGSTNGILITSPDEGAQTPTNNFLSIGSYTASGNAVSYAYEDFNIRTNTSAQIRVQGLAGGSIGYYLETKGFVYPRGLQ